ncbi:uncharacterized protein LOC110266767 [Arachis ipaensis]|uniref:uncharacterized protein LOC110266767 n=1 Tax=Arachis ipaensis TaxID=130454 RepID=UPI000A2B6A5D|nr:uncharacterized protein LOC110266767 [Arachis ipaensis]
MLTIRFCRYNALKFLKKLDAMCLTQNMQIALRGSHDPLLRAITEMYAIYLYDCLDPITHSAALHTLIQLFPIFPFPQRNTNPKKHKPRTSPSQTHITYTSAQTSLTLTITCQVVDAIRRSSSTSFSLPLLGQQYQFHILRMFKAVTQDLLVLLRPLLNQLDLRENCWTGYQTL